MRSYAHPEGENQPLAPDTEAFETAKGELAPLAYAEADDGDLSPLAYAEADDGDGGPGGGGRRLRWAIAAALLCVSLTAVLVLAGVLVLHRTTRTQPSANRQSTEWDAPRR